LDPLGEICGISLHTRSVRALLRILQLFASAEETSLLSEEMRDDLIRRQRGYVGQSAHVGEL
jgi:hypothetical protein